MKNLGTSCLVAILIASMAAWPAFGATAQPLGLVIQAQDAHLEAAVAAAGATVYPGDGLSTDSGGTLRLKVGGGQIYMLSQTGMRLAQVDGYVQADVARGTVGFSSGSADRMQLQTPMGVVRAAGGKPAYGQVSILSPTQMTISAFTGDLELNYNGDVHEISAGNSYSVSLEADPASSAQGPSGSGTTSAINHHIIVKVIAAAVVGVTSYILYKELCESPSKVR